MSTRDSNHRFLPRLLLALASAGLASVLSLASLSLPASPASGSGYPYPDAPDCTEVGSDAGCVADDWNFYQGQCTSWVAWKLNTVNGVKFHNWYKGVRWSDARNWDNAARSVGVPVNRTPARGAVAQWEADNHVAYVEKVNNDGSIVISDMNRDLQNGVRTNLTLQPGRAGWPDAFIHIRDLGPSESNQSYKGKIVRNRTSGAAYLVKTDGKRYHIPTGGDYQAIVNNGVKVVNLSAAEIRRIPAGSDKVTVKRVDEPAISGPSKWMTKRTNTRHGYGRDYWITTSAAGKSYTTNAATWKLTGRPNGIYRVKVFIPHREAVAGAKYKIYDGSRHLKTITVKQKNYYGWTSLGDYRFRSGTVKIVQADNWGSGPYNSIIGWDAAEAVPLR